MTSDFGSEERVAIGVALTSPSAGATWFKTSSPTFLLLLWLYCQRPRFVLCGGSGIITDNIYITSGYADLFAKRANALAAQRNVVIPTCDTPRCTGAIEGSRRESIIGPPTPGGAPSARRAGVHSGEALRRRVSSAGQRDKGDSEVPDDKRILITGASGLIGRVLREALADTYELSGVDFTPIAGFDSLAADMTDLDAILPAFEGKDVVIDLAANPDNLSPWEVVYENNLPATYNALEAARRTGVKRVIFASSNHATGMYELDHPYSAIVEGKYEDLEPSAIPRITVDMPIRPDGPYGIGKAFGEGAGRYYSDQYGLSVICLRIGTLNRESRPLTVRNFATLLTHRDLVHLVERCIEAPDDVRFAIFYGVSDNTWRLWDISNSLEAIGYRPQNNAEAWR